MENLLLSRLPCLVGQLGTAGEAGGKSKVGRRSKRVVRAVGPLTEQTRATWSHTPTLAVAFSFRPEFTLAGVSSIFEYGFRKKERERGSLGGFMSQVSNK